MNQIYIEKIKLLEQENVILKQDNEILKQRLSKYTNSPSYKKYYEANKEKINEMRKNYAKEYYQKKKLEKIKQ